MRKLLGIVTVVALAGPVLVTAVRFVHTGQRLPILLASFSAYTVLGFLLVLVVAALGLAVQGWSLAPLLTGGSAGSRT